MQKRSRDACPRKKENTGLTMTIVVKADVLFVLAFLLQLSTQSSAEPAISSRSVRTARGAVVCDECEVRGDVTIGANNLIHARASIIAEAGPIVIGNNNIIEDRAVIINRLHPGESLSSNRVLYIGNNNIFKVESHSEALKIGNNNILQSNCFVGRDVEVTDNSIVSAGCSLTCPEVVGPNAVTCGHQCR